MTFDLRRGTNISHWLSQSTRRGQERKDWFQEVDVMRIADMGFDHVRLPFDEEQLWDEQGNLDPESLDLMEAAIDWCERADLRIVLDLHILRSHHFIHTEEPPLFTDPEEAQRFAGLWRDISDRMKQRPNDRVAYELLNESVAEDSDDWNRVSRTAYDAIRSLEPERTVVLGSNRWNSPDTFDQLEVPADDPNLILTFHFYKPSVVTHYTAPWTPIGRYDGPIRYPGALVPQDRVDEVRAVIAQKGRDRNLSEAEIERRVNETLDQYDRAAMIRDISEPLAVREDTGLPLYCGEFGCYQRCPQDIRAAWYKDIISVFGRFNIAWANWDYKGGFGIINPEGEDTGIAKFLLA